MPLTADVGSANMKALTILLLTLALPLRAITSEPFVVATNSYHAFVDTFCKSYNTMSAAAMLEQMDLRFTKTRSLDLFRIQSFKAIYTNVSNMAPLPIGSVSNPAWIEIGISPSMMPKHPVLYSCKFNHTVDGYMEFYFPIFRGYAASNACQLLIGITQPNDSEKRPNQHDINRKRQDEPTRGWCGTRAPRRVSRPTALTLGSIIRPSHRQAGEQIRHPRLKGHHPDYDLLWPAGRSGPGKSSRTGLNFGGRRSESQQEVGHVRRARSRPPKEEIQTAAGQPRRWDLR